MDALLIGFPSMQVEASREQRTELIHLMGKRYPDKSEAERFELLQAMSSLDRYRMLLDRDDRSSGDQFVTAGYDPLGYGADAGGDGVQAPAPSWDRGRGWY